MNVGLIETYLQAVRELPELAPEDARSLAWLSWSGDRAARQAFIERHLWLVVDLAERMHPGDGRRQAAAIASGNRALIRAAEIYRPWADGDFTGYVTERLLAEIGEEVLPQA